MSEYPAFIPTNNVQMKHQPHMEFKHSQSVKFNMPMPQLKHAISATGPIGNLRKQGSKINDIPASPGVSN